MHFRIAANEVIKAFRSLLGAVGREVKIMVLEVESDAGQIDNRLHARRLQLLGVAYEGLIQSKELKKNLQDVLVILTNTRSL